jgi:dipeptidase D
MSDNPTLGLKPEILWQRFYEISRVPRPSKKEEKIIKYLKNFISELNLQYRQDKIGNIVISVPATPGYENTPKVILQGHIDMVCEKNKSTKHDFENDPIKLVRQDGWIAAEGTTLGSDNGIGVAAGLALITDKEAVHGPLEILLTVDEETGLTGATNLKKGLINGNILLNLDSEEDGAFYVGCSGGIDTVAEFKLELSTAPRGMHGYDLIITGLKGGHSGLDIHTKRGNAIKLIGRALGQLGELNYSIVRIEGGSLRNAIPRETEALILLKNTDVAKAKRILKRFEAEIQNELKVSDSGFRIEFNKSKETVKKVFKKSFGKKVIDVLLGLPNGVIAMSQEIHDLVETSTSLATIHTTKNSLLIATSQRSSVNSANRFISESVAAIFKLAGAKVQTSDGYPGWVPNLDSNILNLSKEVYKDLFNKEPEIKAIHAGLECGILEGKNPGMDMVSFGPTIQGAHSPNEKVNIETVEKFYKLLKGILKRIAEVN